MGSSQLDDRREMEFIAWVASALGLSVEELSEQDFDVDEIDGNDGAVYGHRVTFGEGSDSEVLAKIDGLQDGFWVNIGFPPDEPEPEQPD